VLLSVLLRQEQSSNYTKIQEIKGHLVLWTNSEVIKLVHNVEVEFRRLFLYKPRISRTLSRTCKSHVTWIDVQESTFAWINQTIEAFTRLMSNRIFNVHLRLWTLKYHEYSNENIILDVAITPLQLCFHY